MGGSSYDYDVGTADPGKNYSSSSSKTFSSKSTADPMVLISPDRRIFTDAKNPIVIALDVTGSMGDSAKIMFDKMPMFWGQMEQKNFLADPAVSFAAIGDAYCDRAPLQVTDFERAKAIHPWLKRVWLEGGGGGNDGESYDLAALFYVDRCNVPNMEHGFFFFIGDENYFDQLDGKDTAPIFQELMKKFDTFYIHWPYGTIGGSEDTRICNRWKKLMGERFIVLDEPKAIVDVMLGLIAMRMGVYNMNEYEQDMADRGQTKARINKVKSTIKKFDTKALVVKDEGTVTVFKDRVLLPDRNPFRNRRGF